MSERNPLFRFNRFTVPEASREEFRNFLDGTLDFLRAQQGYVRDLMLERQSEPGMISIMTLIEFSGPEVVDTIGPAMAENDRRTGLDRLALMARLGATAEMANYGLMGA